MKDKTKAFLSAVSQEATFIKTALFFVVLLLTVNLGAMVDSVLHPEIPYFDEEHLIVGFIYALLLSVLFLSLAIYDTNRRKMEETLENSESKYKDLAELLPQFVFETDDKGNILFLNHYALENLGYAQDDINKSLNAFQMFIPEELCRVEENIQRVVNGEILDGLEFTAQRKDGTIFPVLLFVSPRFYESNIVGIRGITIDISERKRLEQEQQKFASLIENSSDFIGIATLDGKLLYLNHSGRELVGLNQDNVKEKTMFDFFFVEDLHALKTSMMPKGFWQGEFRLRHFKTQAAIPVEFTGFLIRDLNTGQAIAHAAISRDITKRKEIEKDINRLNTELERKVNERTQQLLEAQEELVRKEKLTILGQLSGSVGHELRNPLGVISNAIYYLKAVMPDADETVREYLDLIRSEVNNSERIISDLLDFARTKTPQTRESTVIELVTRSLAKCSIPENIVLAVDVPETLPAVMVDPLQMCQVFQNLIMNAVQAMPEGGELGIVGAGLAPALCRGGQPQGVPLQKDNFIEISVSDTGEGISPENMKKLFQPLFTTKAKGIGLGLVACRNLVEANGGRIEVESGSGKGTTFTVILPCDDGREIGQEPGETTN